MTPRIPRQTIRPKRRETALILSAMGYSLWAAKMEISVRIAFVAAMAALAAPLAHAETGLNVTVYDGAMPISADAKADIGVIEARAATDAERTLLLSSIRDNIRSRSAQGQDITRIMTRYLGGGGQYLQNGQPFAYRIEAQRQAAQERAQLMGQILQADLNGDWQVSRDELAAVLRVDRSGNIADVFVIGDEDSNNILSQEEMQKTIRDLGTTRNGDYRQDDDAINLFDLDDDGILTPEEVARSIAALSL